MEMVNYYLQTMHEEACRVIQSTAIINLKSVSGVPVAPTQHQEQAGTSGHRLLVCVHSTIATPFARGSSMLMRCFFKSAMIRE